MKALQHIEREHPAAAAVVLSYPWVADGITKNDWTALSSLQSISENNATLLQRLVAFPWLANGIGTIFEIYAIGYLAQINLADPSLATRLAGFQWIADNISEEEMFALDHFSQIITEDASLAQQVVGFPWVADGITDAERHRLGRIVSDAAPAATPTPTPTPAHTATPEPALFDFPWIKGGLTADEHKALDSLESIQHEHPDLARVVLGFPWIADSITNDEMWVLDSISKMAGQDISLAQRIVSYPWVADGIGRYEVGGVAAIPFIAEYDASLALRIVSFPWFADGIIERESQAVSYIVGIISGTAGEEASPARSVVSFPWFADGITEIEAWSLETLWRVSEQDASFARRIAAIPWLADSITLRENQALRVVAGIDVDSASSFLDSPLFVDGPTDILRFRAILASRNISIAGLSALLISQPWFQDGLTDEDSVRIVMLSRVLYDEKVFRELVQGDHVRSETISLPLSGEIKLIVVSRIPYPQDEVFEAMRTGVAEIENLMGVPWPNPNGALLVEPTYPQAGVFLTTGGYVILTGVMSGDEVNSALYHELAHYYFAGGPKWLSEGAPEFFRYYISHITQAESLQDRYNMLSVGCPSIGISNVQGSIEAGARAISTREEDCVYTTGAAFILGMYLSLGPEVVSSYLRQLYLAGQAIDVTFTSAELTEEQIYQILLSNTPPEKQDEFRDLYRRLHGGPIPD